MRLYYTLVPDRDDDLKSGDEVNEQLEDSLEHAKQSMLRGCAVLYKFTNMAPLRQDEEPE